MIPLRKPVLRVVAFEKGRTKLVVGLDPSGMFTFRGHGTRTTYLYPIYRTYFLAVEAAGREKKEARKKGLKRRR